MLRLRVVTEDEYHQMMVDKDEKEKAEKAAKNNGGLLENKKKKNMPRLNEHAQYKRGVAGQKIWRNDKMARSLNALSMLQTALYLLLYTR